jgi:Ca2+-binding RTX toxin-like protein
MTEYVASTSKVLLEDYTSMYNLLPGDDLVIQPDVWLDVQAPHSCIATLGSDTKLMLVGDFFAPVMVSSIDNTFIGTGDRVSVDVGEFSTINSAKGYGLYLQGSYNTIVNSGTISSGNQPAVYSGRGGISSGGMTHLINSGTLQGGKIAAYFSSGGNELHNSGMIDGGMYGLRVMGGGNTITNEDLINAGGTGGAAIYLTSGDGGTNLINNRGGWIKAFNSGYAIQVSGLSRDTVINAPGAGTGASKEGWIHGGIDLGLGDDEIENMGEIRGTFINLGSGNDTVVNTGKIYGDVQLGAGNDIFNGASGLHSDEWGRKAGAIFGGDGADVIIGGAKDEVISGGTGKDYLVGNGGQDTFWFDVAPTAANSDEIAGFNVNEDRFWLSADVLGLSKGALSTDQFCIGTKAQDANDRIVYDVQSGTLLLDQDGTGSLYKAVMFAKVDPGTALKAGHFFIV